MTHAFHIISTTHLMVKVVPSNYTSEISKVFYGQGNTLTLAYVRALHPVKYNFLVYLLVGGHVVQGHPLAQGACHEKRYPPTMVLMHSQVYVGIASTYLDQRATTMNMDDKMVVVRSHPNSTFKNNGELWIPSNKQGKLKVGCQYEFMVSHPLV